MSVEAEKQRVARAGALLVRGGMNVGLGTGSTVAYLLAELAAREVDARFVATSPRTQHAARSLGLTVHTFHHLDRLDIAIDGADQISPEGWLIKGAGGAHTREKVVAASADRFIVIADSRKVVNRLTAPVPLELLSFGAAATLRRVSPATLRSGPSSPDRGVIADFWGDVSDPASLSAWLSSTPGVIGHGLFAPSLVSEILVGRKDRTERLMSGGGA